MIATTHPMPGTKDMSLANSNQYVFLKIAPDILTPCLEFMLSQRIAFEVQYGIKETGKEPLPVQTQDHTMPFSQTQDKNTNIAKAVYDKYVRVISENPLPQIPQIAAEYGISAQKLKVLFQETYKQTMYQAYMQFRMEKSAELLKQGHRANVVSKMIGYGEKSDIKFNKMFQKHFGITPKRYQLANNVYVNSRAERRYEKVR